MSGCHRCDCGHHHGALAAGGDFRRIRLRLEAAAQAHAVQSCGSRVRGM